MEEILKILDGYNITINEEKSEFLGSVIKYCGYIVDEKGIHEDNTKIKAIVDMPRPKNVQEVRAFIGIINYYNRFIQNVTEILHALYKLMREGKKLSWTQVQEKSFENARKAFVSEKVLVFYDQRLPLVLATDASPYGVGAVLSHRYEDGSERVIRYVSQAFS